jgi:quercetin dioxygenase-like cupin family protein
MKATQFLSIAASLFILTAATFAEDATKPFVKQLPPDSIHYTPLAETETFESGCVSLLSGDKGSEHSTQSWQEMLIILKGQGEVIIVDGDTLQIHAGEIAYIPPQTTHNLRCTGDAPLQYVYVAVKATP